MKKIELIDYMDEDLFCMEQEKLRKKQAIKIGLKTAVVIIMAIFMFILIKPSLDAVLEILVTILILLIGSIFVIISGDSSPLTIRENIHCDILKLKLLLENEDIDDITWNELCKEPFDITHHVFELTYTDSEGFVIEEKIGEIPGGEKKKRNINNTQIIFYNGKVVIVHPEEESIHLEVLKC